jgi:hypothetical protein
MIFMALPGMLVFSAFIIHANRHLPGIPREDSVVQQGLDLGSRQVLQQQRIQELTLYAITQEYRLKQQLVIIEKQKQQMKSEKGLTPFK